MSMNVAEIESAIEKLSLSEVSKLSEWFAEFEACIWDKKIERDLQNGKLQNLTEEAEEDFAEENCQPL
ncbi:MAG TPA: hypothetical protein VNI84_18580 [Pyrinomonadaceae bacterium]|nr:hypothetical protein [Pyrinomonadaceae bacterium]